MDSAKRSLHIFPGGSNGEFGLPDSLATVITRGEGYRLWDTNNKEFVDFSIGWGSVLPGHAHPSIVEAVRAQAERLSNVAYVTDQSLHLAERICALSPACERLRFCASGTEATMYCIRLARAFSRKSLVLKFEGAYHGAHDVGVTSLFPQRGLPFPTPEPSSAGTAHAVEDHVVIAPFNDIDTTREIIETYRDQLAAVIVEPLHRCLPPENNFLTHLRAACDASDTLLIFDEVVTGFRLAFGGAQERYGVVPDLVAYGKALGGGYPIGAYGGRADIMDLVREDAIGEDQYVWTASTLGGNPVSCAAANAALDIYEQPATYTHLFELGEVFRARLRETFAARNIPAQIIGDGPLAQFILTDKPVHDYRSTRNSDREMARAIMLKLFKDGVFLNPMGTKLYLSLAHDAKALEQFIDRLSHALKNVT